MPNPVLADYTTDIGQVNAWIYKLLSTDSAIIALVGNHPDFNTVQVYFASSPENATLPMCVFTYMGGSSLNGNSGRKIMKKMRYAIKLIVEGDSIAKALNALSHIENMFQVGQMDAYAQVAGARISSDFCYENTTDGGAKYWHVGFNVEIMAYNNFQAAQVAP